MLEYCSPVWGCAVECHLQLLERQGYSEARLCPDQTFLSLCHRRHVAALCMLYKGNSLNSLYCFCSDLPSTALRVRHNRAVAAAHPLELKYQGVEHPNLQGVSCRPRLVCGMICLTPCLTPDRWMGLRELSIVGCFPEFVFHFSVVQVLVWLRKQFLNNLVFPTLACAAGVFITLVLSKVVSHHFR